MFQLDKVSSIDKIQKQMSYNVSISLQSLLNCTGQTKAKSVGDMDKIFIAMNVILCCSK